MLTYSIITINYTFNLILNQHFRTHKILDKINDLELEILIGI